MLVYGKILESFEPKLSACKNLPGVFIILSTVWSWFNHFLLGTMISGFAPNGGIKATYDSYIAECLNPYLQRSIFEIINDSFGPDDGSHCRMTNDDGDNSEPLGSQFPTYALSN